MGAVCGRQCVGVSVWASVSTSICPFTTHLPRLGWRPSCPGAPILPGGTLTSAVVDGSMVPCRHAAAVDHSAI